MREDPGLELFQDTRLLRKRRTRFTTLILQTYAFVAGIMGISGFGYLLYTVLPPLSNDQQLALLIGATGVLVSLLSLAMLALYKQSSSAARFHDERDSPEAFLVPEAFLIEWGQFERLARELLSDAGETINRTSIRSIMDALLDRRIIDKDDIAVLDRALSVRNSIVHGRDPREVSVGYDLVEFLRELKIRLSGRLKSMPINSDEAAS